ncbi:MAG: hypothetical protein HWE11_06785 [Gammaproteobacteria bacterium]|nr:hypothetical protein [Gammaproteobacteria bacterium]
MKRLVYLLGLCCLLNLTGCTMTYRSSIDESTAVEEAEAFRGAWLEKNEQAVTNEIVAHIKSHYPHMADDFPYVQVGNITLNNDDEANEAIASQLSLILQQVTKQLYPQKGERDTWYVDAHIEYWAPAQSSSSNLAKIAAVPYMVFCWKSVLAVCPVISGDYLATINAKVTVNEVTQFSIVAKGAANMLATSPLVADNPNYREPVKSKALAAALADLAQQIVAAVSRPNNSEVTGDGSNN